MRPALARIKRALRAAVDMCGGCDGAAATAGRKRSVAGDWGNLHHDAFPPVDCALALDEVAIATGQHPPILSAIAAELGCVVIRLPGCAHGDGNAVTAALVEASAEFGDVACEVRDALKDRDLSEAERQRIVLAIDEAQRSLAAMRVTVAGGEG